MNEKNEYKRDEDANEISESNRKKLDMLDRRLHKKVTLVLSFVIVMNEKLNYLEKSGRLSPEIIAQQRKQISEIKKSAVKIMTEGESKHIFQSKYR